MRANGVKTYLKRLLLPEGPAPRIIRGGILRGLRMWIDFSRQTQLWLGFQERELAPWFRGLSQNIQTAIDVGAAEGAYVLYFLAKTPARRVLAFEPSADCATRMTRNVRLNGLENAGRLEIVNKCVAGLDSEQEVTLDSVSPAIAPPCLIKIDVEGAEVSVLRGSQKLLEMPGMRWIIEVHSQPLQQECRRILEEKGYRVEVVPNAWWRMFVSEFRPIEFNQWLIATREDASGSRNL